jgi:hypothetical protein
MTENADVDEVQWPSIDDHHPHEEGGPMARAGFSYQDDIVVGVFLDMIEDASIRKVHCETHDDVAVVRLVDEVDVVEYVQVKSNEPDTLWSIASLCSKGADSVCTKSLTRDEHKEASRFRVVTLRDVNSELKLLTYPCYGPGREKTSEEFTALVASIKSKLPELRSVKGNSIDYWLEHCRWDVCHNQDIVRQGNIFRVIRIAAHLGAAILPEQAEAVEQDLRSWAYDAGRAFWIPDKAKKIINREELLTWWTQKLDAIASGGSNVSGVKLREKMDEASLSDDQIRMALELRRDYAQMVRTPRYMSEREVPILQRRVKSELATLRAGQMASELPDNGAIFHSLCLQKMDAIDQASPNLSGDQSAFLKGCMYDIADRCLHRFIKQRR